jgi:hypothetical protein
MRDLILPKFWVLSGLAAASFVAGALAAWYETVILLGSLPVGRTLIGIGTGALFELFVVAVVVYAAGRSASFIQTSILAIAVVFLMPLLENVGDLQPWLPSRLPGMLMDLDRSYSVGEYVKPVLVTAIAIPALVILGIRRLERREL